MILEELPLQKLVIPSVDELLAEGEVLSYPYNPDYEKAKNDPFFVLHTSGSTGQHTLFYLFLVLKRK